LKTSFRRLWFRRPEVDHFFSAKLFSEKDCRTPCTSRPPSFPIEPQFFDSKDPDEGLEELKKNQDIQWQYCLNFAVKPFLSFVRTETFLLLNLFQVLFELKHFAFTICWRFGPVVDKRFACSTKRKKILF